MQYVTREILAWCLILLGAFFLAKSIVVKGQKWTMKELLGLRIDKLKFFRNHIIQRLEAAFGFLFIFLGVGFHLYVLLRKSYDHDPREAYVHLTEVLLVTLAATVLFAIVFHFVCKYVSRKVFLDLLAYLIVRYGFSIEDDQALLKQLGETMDLPMTEDDTVESYARRIEDGLKLEKVRDRLRKKHKPIELE